MVNANANSEAILYGISPPYEFESPTSWLTRAALSQGASPRELAQLFGIKRRAIDLDISLFQFHIRRISSVCRLDPSVFDFARHMFTGLQSFDRKGDTFLLFDQTVARYRYCPVCLNEQAIKHFPVHWRFKSWRYCPLHSCMMEDACRKCGLFIKLPGNLMEAGPGNFGIAFLNQCLGCGNYLNDHWRKVIGILKKVVLHPGETSQLKMGRAVLAVIYYRHLYCYDIKYKFPMKLLNEYSDAGLIPHDLFLLNAQEIERRLAYCSKTKSGN